MKNLFFILIGLGTVSMYSCSKFLDAKPDQALALPDNVRDLQALLDYENRITLQYPAAGDVAADYYFLEVADLQSRNIDVRNTYLWASEAQNTQDWNYAYTRIFYCNVVLDGIADAELGSMTESDRNEVKGRAHFFRGWTYLQLAQLFCPHYTVNTEDSEYGLPLKLKSDVNEPIFRSSVSETYEQIFSDLLNAAELLPENSVVETRPSKAAAFGALARANLIMGDYTQALSFAERCLQIKNTLLDYNALDIAAPRPFPVLNDEVIFHSIILGTSGVHAQSRAFVDSTLIVKYERNDLRKDVFFQEDDNGYYRFKGSYDGENIALFGGLATDELYLIKAECLARFGRFQEAGDVLDQLLVKRWANGHFSLGSQPRNEDLLEVIWEEREKELAFRGGIRWADLRRLSEEGYTKTIRREVGDEVFELSPNDKRYTFLLPLEVIEMSGLKQNPR